MRDRSMMMYVAYFLWLFYPTPFAVWAYRKKGLNVIAKVLICLFAVAHPLGSISYVAREYVAFIGSCPLIVLVYSIVELIYFPFTWFVSIPFYMGMGSIVGRYWFIAWFSLFGAYYIFNESKKKEDRFLDWVFDKIEWKPPRILFPFLVFATFPAILFWN